MADKKISQLGATTTPVNADLFAIVQSGVTKKITYQNLVAAIVAETSLDLNQVLTNGNTTGGVDIVITLEDLIKSATANRSQLDFGAAGDQVILSTDGGVGDEGWFNMTSTSLTLGVPGSALILDVADAILSHGTLITIGAPTVKFSGNFIVSQASNKTEMYFGASGDQFDVSTDGGTNAESRILLTPTTAGFYFAGDGYIEVTASETRLFHDTKLLFNAPIYNFSQLTASTIPYLDASKNLVSSAITPTELGYLTGASSNLQSQIDALVTGLSWKQAVRVATTGPGTLASDFENGDTIDGVILITGDRILIKDQASATENGIYVVNASGAPTRASDMNVAAEFSSATVAVSAGTTNADTQWVCTNDAVIIGITNITFVAVGGTTYVGTTGKITVTGNVINVGSNIMLLDGTTPLTANWDAGDFEIKFTDFKAKTSSGGSLVSSGGNDCFSFGIGGGATNTAYGGLKLDYSTASTIAIIDSNKNLISADTATYPSLTELSYIKGLTSAIQTQLDNRLINLNKTATSSAVTGTAANTLLDSLLIPANTLKVGTAFINLRNVWTTTLSSKTCRIYINTSNSLIGATLLGTYVAGSGALSIDMGRVLSVKSLTSLEVFNSSVSANSLASHSQISSAPSVITYDSTVDNYIIVAIQHANTGDSCVNSFINFQI